MNSPFSAPPAVVITSIAGSEHPILRAIAHGAAGAGWRLFIIGDTKSPAQFDLPGAEFYSVDRQVATGGKFAALCPTRHYARKNVGYLLAIAGRAPFILETDDDNISRENWFRRER